MITALLVDDEPKAIERLSELLEAFPSVDIIGTARDVADAERFLAGRVPDVVFLDINMPGRPGFELVARVPATTRIVFVTAHEDRAVDAFRFGAVDYILKPVDRDRLAVTIERLEALSTSPGPATQEGGDRPAADDEAGDALGDTDETVTFSATGGRAVEVVSYADILWIEAVRNYSRVQARGRRLRIVRRTMAEWEAALPATAFGRLSRSLIVQLPAIRSTQWQSRDQTLVFFRDVDEPLPVGRSATSRLKDLLPK
jgi:two-component system LytT family response regulator